MMTVVMPPRHMLSVSFSIAGYRDIDSAEDKSPYFAYLDSFANAFSAVTEAGVDLLRLRSGDSVRAGARRRHDRSLHQAPNRPSADATSPRQPRSPR